jgi:PAS domain S-box-containing protein
MTSSLEKKVLSGLGLAGLIIAGVTVIGHVRTHTMMATAQGVSRSHQLIAALTGFSSNMHMIRMSLRGYIVTGDTDLLRMHETAKVRLKQHLGTIRSLSADQQPAQTRLRAIDAMTQAKLDDTQRLMQLYNTYGRVAATIALTASYRDDVDDPLREHMESMLAATQSELARRQNLAAASGAAMFWMLAMGAFVEGAFVIAAALIIRRGLAQRKQYIEAVEQSELMLRSFYDSGVTMMGIVEMLEDDVVIVSANGLSSQVFGRPANELVGQKVSDLGSSPEVIALFLRKFHESFRRGGPVEFEYERQTVNGVRWLSTAVCPIARWAPQGRPRFSYVLLDITDRKLAEEALRKHTADLTLAKEALELQSVQLETARREADAASAAKSSFLANMSHEIRTPMTAIVGYSDLIAEPGRADAERLEWTAVIRRNASHLLELINDILDLSKIEAGKMTLESIACDPAQVVGDVVDIMRPRAAEKGIGLRLDFDSSIPRLLHTDPLRLRQVLVNLIGNAVKFTEAGEVAVVLRCDEASAGSEMLAIEVRDTGIGMTPDEISRLFRAFSQADETTTRRFGGTGLGLAISQRLVLMMKGTLEVHSEPGIGSTFRMSIPTAATAATEPVAEILAEAIAATTAVDTTLRGRILVAEDSIDTQRLVAFLLRRAGAEVHLVSTGRAALEAAHHGEYDLILMDMQMPELDGYTAAAELRRRGISVPILAITAHAMAGDRERCLAAGCTDYLTKPLDRRQLVARIAQHLSHRAAGNALVA